MNISILYDARARVAAVLQEIERLKQSEFPYSHPRAVLDLLKERFKRRSNTLNRASVNTDVDALSIACKDSLRELYVYVPILGFALRATNVRNAFEAHGPLQRLARGIMGDDTNLIISSEWEFSPYVYRAITGLSGFVLIGLPAPESSNPLVIPLAGHELGHSVWEHENIGDTYQEQIEKDIVAELIDNQWDKYKVLYPTRTQHDIKSGEMFAQLTLRPAYTWALLQSEETFCDFFGLRLFAESYLYAFAYLLSPGISGQRSLGYPNIKRRVSQLVQAAESMSIDVPTDYEKMFEKEIEPTDPTTKLLVSLADKVSASLIRELIQHVVDFAKSKQVPEKNADKVKTISEDFGNWVTPTKEKESLVDIVNAGWICNMDEHLWENVPNLDKEEKDRILRDIMFKSMEIAEIFCRLEQSS